MLLAANSTGTKKLKPLVIERFKNPHCFKDVKSEPVNFEENPKAWMNTALFSSWLSALGKKMKTKKRKILLFIDNCIAHTHLPKLSKAEILSPNTTSELQPLDQGTIQSFECFYRQEIVSRILSDIFRY